MSRPEFHVKTSVNFPSRERMAATHTGQTGHLPAMLGLDLCPTTSWL